MFKIEDFKEMIEKIAKKIEMFNHENRQSGLNSILSRINVNIHSKKKSIQNDYFKNFGCSSQSF